MHFWEHLSLFCVPSRCLLKWLEIRSVCPMCNKPILRLHPDPTQGTEGPQDPEEVWRTHRGHHDRHTHLYTFTRNWWSFYGHHTVDCILKVASMVLVFDWALINMAGVWVLYMDVDYTRPGLSDRQESQRCPRGRAQESVSGSGPTSLAMEPKNKMITLTLRDVVFGPTRLAVELHKAVVCPPPLDQWEWVKAIWTLLTRIFILQVSSVLIVSPVRMRGKWHRNGSHFRIPSSPPVIGRYLVQPITNDTSGILRRSLVEYQDWCKWIPLIPQGCYNTSQHKHAIQYHVPHTEHVQYCQLQPR